MNQEKGREIPRSSHRHFAALDSLPDAFVIPADLQTRFGYDQTRKGLTFEGYMCKATYDRLRGVSHDYHYQRALEQLFQVSVPEDDASSRIPWLLLAVGVVVSVVTVAAVWAALRWQG